MLITSSIDATPIQCMRIPGPTYITLIAAIAVGGIFIFPTFKMYGLMGVSIIASIAVIAVWMWTGTGEIPEKDTKDVGLGVTLPLYMSGRHSAGWWAMGITMLAVFTAYVCLVFGYIFYWTLHERFVPDDAGSLAWIAAVGLAATTAAWGLTMTARRANTADRARAFYACAAASVVAALAGGALIPAHLYLADLNPTVHVYAAIVWVLAIWSAVQTAIGAVMLAYCIARRAAGRMDARHDIDIVNVELYWHFTMVTNAITVALNAGVPLLV